MADTILDPSRFKCVDASKIIGSSRIRNRIVQNRKAFIGDFVSRLWALYGPPNEIGYEGFLYAFQDTITGLFFTAYSAGSGPAFGGYPTDEDKLLPVLEAFENILKSTTPVECQIEYDTDFGRYRSGSHNGQPFDEQIEV